MLEYKTRMNTYIHSLIKDEENELQEIENIAIKDEVPIIKKGARCFLRNLLSIKNPDKILEIGTAIGFSAILISNALPKSKITTIENFPRRIKAARDNFSKYGYNDKIELIEADAVEFLKTHNDKYDFIFLDAAKGQYISVLPDIIRLLTDGGILLADNVLQDAQILESKFVVERRDRTIHKRMREYLYEIMHNPYLKSSIIPVDDGLALSIKC